jgi:hypothetical protein
MNENTKTRTIAGHKITLTPGCKYMAGRPGWPSRDGKYPISITIRETGETVHTIENLTLDEANDFLCEFNDGPTGLHGREW